MNEHRLNVLPSRNTENDWTLSTAQEAGLVMRVRKIPGAVDLRESWWRVQNQKNTGACVGFSIAYGLLWWHWVNNGKSERDKPSARFVWMASKETDSWTRFPTSFVEGSGTYIKDALTVCRKHGVIADNRLSMRAETTSIPESTLYAEAARNRIVSYHRLNGPTEWRQWIASQGPVVCQLSPDEQFMRASRRDRVLEKYDIASANYGGHAIVLAGYGPEHFIVRNSWGTRWGYKGYQIVTQEYALSAFREAYGIVA